MEDFDCRTWTKVFKKRFDETMPVEQPVPFRLQLMIEHLRRAEEALELAQES